MKLKHNMDIDATYKDVEKLINKLAWRWHEKYFVDFDDCKSECHVAFLTAFRRFDPKRKGGAKFSTLVQMICQFRLRRMIMERVQGPRWVALEEWTEGANTIATEIRSESLALCHDLSDDAKEIVSLIFEMPGDLKGFRRPMEPKDYLMRIREYLVKKRGRKEYRVNRATTEIRQTLRAAWATA